MKAINSFRRSAILFNKRLDLFRYNAQVRMNRGNAFDISADINMMENQVRSLNLLDFNRNSKQDLFLIDQFSDQTELGGLSHADFSITQLDNDINGLKVTSELKMDSSGLVPTNQLYAGLRCLNLVSKNFEFFNGFRITMKQPAYPVKFGVYLETSLKEYEHFVAHILDLNSTPNSSANQQSKIISYEIPIRLMVNNLIENKLVQSTASTDEFKCKGLTMTLEASTSQVPQEPVEMEIQKIDIIHREEFDKVIQVYRMPVFFKSVNGSYDQAGQIDNGRQQVPFSLLKLENPHLTKRESINAIGFDPQSQSNNQSQNTSAKKATKSIKDRLKERKS